MTCEHQYKTINTVSRQAFKQGSKKFRSGFEEANFYGIRIITARQKQCRCGKKKTTVELDKFQLDEIYQVLRTKNIKLEDNLSAIGLSSIEQKVRKYLIKVSKNEIPTRHNKKAMYKEVWLEVYPSRAFGRGNTNEVVEWIVNISDYDIDQSRPPLNALVVRGDTGMPGDSWDEWRKNSSTMYRTARQAQDACWEYWN